VTGGRGWPDPAADGDEIAALGAAFGALLADLRDERALGAALDAARAAPAGGAGATGRGAPARPGRAQPPARRAAPAGRAPGAAGRRPGRRRRARAGRGAGRALPARRRARGRGTGTVWRARDRTLGEWVAVKVLRPALAAADAGARERFTHELRLARRLTHRNVVRLHDLGEDGGVLFLTMEYVEGTSLAALLGARGALPAPAVLSVAKQLTRALDVAHGQGVLHGDLKPANLLVGPGGVLKVADFGVARLVHAPGAPGGGAAGRAARHRGRARGDAGVHGARTARGRGADGAQRPLLRGARAAGVPDGRVALRRRHAGGVLRAQARRAPRRRRRRARWTGRCPRRRVSPPASAAHDPADRPASAREAYALFAQLG
jgi:serine/threonine-protein kinase